jgi:hypothetical protein
MKVSPKSLIGDLGDCPADRHAAHTKLRRGYTNHEAQLRRLEFLWYRQNLHRLARHLKLVDIAIIYFLEDLSDLLLIILYFPLYFLCPVVLERF